MTLTKDNLGLISIIENNNQVLSESLRCYKTWRKNAGELKDVPIYAFCFTDKKPDAEYLRYLKVLNVTYVDKDLPNYGDVCRWFNMPVGCAYLENYLSEEYLMYLDCDIIISNEVPTTYEFDLVVEPVYDMLNAKTNEFFDAERAIDIEQKQNLFKYYSTDYTEINTQIMITRRENGIWNKWLKNFEGMLGDREGIEGAGGRYDWIEEYSFDVTVKDLEYNCVPVTPTIYHGSTVSEKSKEENVFLSQHIDTKVDYIRIMTSKEF